MNDDNDRIAYLGFGRDLSVDDTSHTLSGEEVHNWQPLQLKWCVGDKYLSENTISKEEVIFNDFVLIVGAGVNIIANEKAKLALQDKLKSAVQFLPINVVGEESNWFLINPLDKINNAISEEKSQYRKFASGRRILRKPVFNDKVIPNNTTFTHPPSYRQWYVKGEFLKDLVNQHGLTGLNFDSCDVDIAEAS